MSIVLASVGETPEQLHEVLERRGYAAQVEPAPGSPPSAETPPAPGKGAPPEPGAAVTEEQKLPASAEPPAKEPGEAVEKPADAPGASPQEPKESRKRLQKRFSDLTRARHEAQRQASTLRQERDQLQERLERLESAKGSPPDSGKPEAAIDAADPKPALDSFESYELYSEALTQWAARQATSPLRAEIQRLTEQIESGKREETDRKARQPVLDAFESGIEAVRAAHADFDDVVLQAAADGTDISEAMRQELFEFGEDGGEIAYFLATHPEECKRIAEATVVYDTSSPDDIGRAIRTAARELGRISARLTGSADPGKAAAGESPKTPAPTPTKPRPISQSPPPVETVGTRAAASSGATFRQGMPMKEYREMRARQREMRR